MKINLIRILIISVIILAGMVVFQRSRIKTIKEDYHRTHNNLLQNEKEYLNYKGETVVKVSALEVENKDLRKIRTKQAEDLSEYEKKLLTARKTIEELGLKIKNIQSVTDGQYQVTGVDTVFLDKKDSVYILSEVNDGYLKGHFTEQSLFSGIDLSGSFEANTAFIFDYTYSDSISIAISRERLPYRQKTGNFLKKLFTRQYKTYSYATATNPRAKYKHSLIEKD